MKSFGGRTRRAFGNPETSRVFHCHWMFFAGPAIPAPSSISTAIVRQIAQKSEIHSPQSSTSACPLAMKMHAERSCLSANSCEDPQVSVQRTDANLGHQRRSPKRVRLIQHRDTEKSPRQGITLVRYDRPFGQGLPCYLAESLAMRFSLAFSVSLLLCGERLFSL